MYEVMLIASVIVLIAVVIAFAFSPACSIFHPLALYIVFHALVFVIRPILGYFLEYRLIYRTFMFTPSVEEKTIALGAATLGFVVFAFCSLRSGNVAMRFRNDSFAMIEREKLARVFAVAMAICLPVGLYSMYSFWSDVSAGQAYEGMVRDARTLVMINTTGSGYLLEAQLMLAPCVALIAWMLRFRVIALVPILAYVLITSGSGGRGAFVAALAMTALLYLYDRRQRFPGGVLIGAAAAVLVWFSALTIDRGAGIRAAMGFEEHQQRRTQYGEVFMEGMDFANLEFLEYVVYVVPRRSGTYDYFLEHLQLFTEPIPRALWSGKPVGPPIQFFRLADYGFPIGLTRSLPGVGWYGLGWVGVVIWCGLWGLILGWIYRKFAEGPQNALHVAAYMTFVPILIVAYRDGQVTTIFRQGLFYLAPVVVTMLLARRAGLPTAQDLRVAALRILRRRRLAGAMAAAREDPASLDERAPVDSAPAEPVPAPRRAPRPPRRPARGGSPSPQT
jgi:oligosaccharide repeat unit polymerase